MTTGEPWRCRWLGHEWRKPRGLDARERPPGEGGVALYCARLGCAEVLRWPLPPAVPKPEDSAQKFFWTACCMECMNCGAPAVTPGPVPLCEGCKSLSRPRGINFQGQTKPQPPSEAASSSMGSPKVPSETKS